MPLSESFDTKKYKTEAEEKWGRTEAYKEYEEKTADYSEGKRNDAAEGIDRIMADRLCPCL